MEGKQIATVRTILIVRTIYGIDTKMGEIGDGFIIDHVSSHFPKTGSVQIYFLYFFQKLRGA